MQDLSNKDINSKDEFVRLFAEKTGFTLIDSKDILDAYIDIFKEACRNRSEINISGFGKLTHTLIPKRIGSKPQKGKVGSSEQVEYPEATRSNFKLAKTLRELSKGEIE